MKEHDELMQALELWYKRTYAGATVELRMAFEAYRNAPKPLILEPTYGVDLSVKDADGYLYLNSQCYRIPETG